jgi:glucosamine--fructose-6-phosphate aminotransferase (isomerizing)
MCGIIGAVAKRNITPILIDGLKRLEYRGYDSAGIALIDEQGKIARMRRLGKVAALEDALKDAPISGHCGIAHTRWATHGKPSEVNAHPHVSKGKLAIVHNGIIENYVELKADLQKQGYQFNSETDSEVIVHLIESYLAPTPTLPRKQGRELLDAVQKAVKHLRGAYAIAILSTQEPEQLIAVRQGSPLIIGIGEHEHFIASDHLALLPVTQKFIFLEEGDCVKMTKENYTIYDGSGKQVERNIYISELSSEQTDKGHYRHYMLKEIYEQPIAIGNTLEGRLEGDEVLPNIFGQEAWHLFRNVERIQIVACGTSYHAGLAARYWIESLAHIPCHVEIASEFRYRHNVVEENTLFVTLSQSGETADTLAALRKAKTQGYISTLSICNVSESSLTRESHWHLLTRAGPEVGVASTKAFTTQLTALLLLTAALIEAQGESSRIIVDALRQLPIHLETALALDKAIERLAERFTNTSNALFLGRGIEYPIALEGALKLKEISYIHAEAYPAGELKHGPLALVDEHMPVIALAPKDELTEKLLSNLQEVKARGGKLVIFADHELAISEEDNVIVIKMPSVHELLAPIIYTIPMQLLAYHVALVKGTDVDKPRNLAKSVTVE